MRPGGGLPCTLTLSPPLNSLVHRAHPPPPQCLCCPPTPCTKLPPWPVCTRGHSPPSSPPWPTQWARPGTAPARDTARSTCTSPPHTRPPPPWRTRSLLCPSLSQAPALQASPRQADPTTGLGAGRPGRGGLRLPQSSRPRGEGAQSPGSGSVLQAALVMGVIDLCLGAASAQQGPGPVPPQLPGTHRPAGRGPGFVCVF